VPTYQYACTACGHELEAVQSFSDEALTQCPACEGRLRKVFSAVGIVFKGSGFYRTDSRGGDKVAAGATAPKESASASNSTDSGSSGGSPSTPAPSGGSEKSAPAKAPTSSGTPAKATASTSA
jgi:putative FmdB family regulatory protein